MADKLKLETLVALEYEECKASGMDLPIYVKEWIAQHGEPDVEKIMSDQQEAIPFDRPGAGKLNRDELPPLLDNILVAAETYGDGSIECTKAIYEAHDYGYSYNQISKMLHKGQSWISSRSYQRSPILIEFQELLDEEKDPKSERMIEFYKKANKGGVSSYVLSHWTGIRRSEMNQLLKN